MRNISLDSNNNLVIEDGALRIYSGLDEYLQAVRNALATFQGEWFLNPGIGVPYYEKIFDKLLERSALRSIFVDQIKTVPGTLSVDEISFELGTGTRILSVDFTVSSVYGSGNTSVDLSI